MCQETLTVFALAVTPFRCNDVKLSEICNDSFRDEVSQVAQDSEVSQVSRMR